jgi:hypothetical protein
MPEYFFKPNTNDIGSVLETVAAGYKFEKREDLSHDGIHIWQGAIRKQPQLWLTEVPVTITYNPESEYPLRISTLGPYLASEIPHLRNLLEAYQKVTKSDKIRVNSAFS